MQSQKKSDKLLTVKDGYLICPVCRRNKRVMQVRPDTVGVNVIAYCRDCKSEILLNIDKGQCYESRSR